jgi:hypothetical protein
MICASRFVNADGATQRRTAPEQNLVDRIRVRPRVRPAPREMRDNLCEQFFTESLILAQDERWRRA